MRTRTFFKSVSIYIVAIASLVATSLLVVAIYLTRLNLPWTSFLTGVLAAAVLSLVSRASRAEWIVARREAKISSLQNKLAQEMRLRHELEIQLAERDAVLTKAQQAPPATPKAPIRDIAQDMYIQSLSEEMAMPQDAISRILSAIEHDEFRLYCQRIEPLNTVTRRTSHYEVLVRLLEEEDGLMPPGTFFPLVEKYGLMPRLDRWVVQHVIEWIGRHPPTAAPVGRSTYFINLATASLTDRTFPGYVRDQLQLHKIPPQALCFEIVEKDLALLHDDIASFANEMHRNGVKIAISNFGKNRVLFEPLLEIHVDFLKIDGSIVLDILRDAADLAQIAAIARVAKAIDVGTIAEFVESDACIDKLHEIGIDYAQGFGVSVPAPLNDLRPAAIA